MFSASKFDLELFSGDSVGSGRRDAKDCLVDCQKSYSQDLGVL